jgi:hypothetical protein
VATLVVEGAASAKVRAGPAGGSAVAGEGRGHPIAWATVEMGANAGGEEVFVDGKGAAKTGLGGVPVDGRHIS